MKKALRLGQRDEEDTEPRSDVPATRTLFSVCRDHKRHGTEESPPGLPVHPLRADLLPKQALFCWGRVVGEVHPGTGNTGLSLLMLKTITKPAKSLSLFIITRY